MHFNFQSSNTKVKKLKKKDLINGRTRKSKQNMNIIELKEGMNNK